MSEQAQGATPFKRMTVLQKGVFICKAAVFILTFGFAFSHVFTDL